MRLEGTVAVVTGGASGIGAAVVERLGSGGARPVVWDLKPGPGAIACDVADAEAVRGAMEETVSRYGAPTAMVLSAGIGGYAPVLAHGLDEWERIMAVNLRGTMLCLQAGARAMRRAGSGGAVVCVSSINGRIPDRGMAAYCCSKAGVDMLTRVAAAELAPHRITVNAVAPGVTETALIEGSGAVPGFHQGVRHRTPLGRLAAPGEVADAIVGLLGMDWVTGHVLVADGGLSLHSPVDIHGAMADAGMLGERR